MKKSLCTVLFWSLVLTYSIGQATTEIQPSKPIYSLSLGVGLSHTALKTEVISPLIFSGTDIPFQLTYRREGALLKSYIQLQYQSTTLKSPFAS